MDSWFKEFWVGHGERIIFMTIATIFAGIFYFYVPDMKGEAKTILVGLAMLCFNKARGNGSPTGKTKV